MLGSSTYARAQMPKNKQNSQIVNSNLKFDGDFHLVLTVHLNGDIFHPSEQDLTQDQQAHWLHGTSGQNPQF